MKILVLLALTFSFSVSKAELLGDWKLHSMIYRGQEMSPPNPDLHLQWTFFSNGTERLYWDRGTEEFCERFADFKVQDNVLHESVFAVNPRNAAECAKDPDMQVGRQTQTKIQIFEDEIRLHMGLGDEDLIYILKKANR